MRRMESLINRTNEYIYNNLDKKITIDALSKAIGVSKFHLHRQFAVATGLEVSEYIQRRKMEVAATLLQQPGATVLDTAIAVGYDSHASFTRVFKQSFGKTPTEAKLISLNEQFIRRNKKEKLPQNEIKWQVVELPRQILQGQYCHNLSLSNFKDKVSQQYADLSANLTDNAFIYANPVGVALTNPWIFSHSNTAFFCGFLNPKWINTDVTISSHCWEAGNYAQTVYQGRHASMWQFISRFHRQWGQLNERPLRNREVYQRYLNHPEYVSPDEVMTELSFPLSD